MKRLVGLLAFALGSYALVLRGVWGRERRVRLSDESYRADITGAGIRSFLVQESTSVEPAVMLLDELRVGTTWADVTPPEVPETGVGLLGSLGALAIFSRRGKR